jgi:hypothetical protein
LPKDIIPLIITSKGIISDGNTLKGIIPKGITPTHH